MTIASLWHGTSTKIVSSAIVGRYTSTSIVAIFKEKVN